MFGWHARRMLVRSDVERWLAFRNDPSDPLTEPVKMMSQMFLLGTELWPVFLAGLCGAVLAITAVGGSWAIQSHFSADAVQVRKGEREAMQQWLDIGEASRLMRCNGLGLVFEDGRCRSTDAGWLIPMTAQAGANRTVSVLSKPEQAPIPTLKQSRHRQSRRHRSWRR